MTKEEQNRIDAFFNSRDYGTTLSDLSVVDVIRLLELSSEDEETEVYVSGQFDNAAMFAAARP